MKLFEFFDGWKTYIGAAGLVGLAIYQLSQGDFATAIQSFMAAIAAFGVKHAITRNAESTKQQLKLMKLHMIRNNKE